MSLIKQLQELLDNYRERDNADDKDSNNSGDNSVINSTDSSDNLPSTDNKRPVESVNTGTDAGTDTVSNSVTVGDAYQLSDDDKQFITNYIDNALAKQSIRGSNLTPASTANPYKEQIEDMRKSYYGENH